MRMRSRTVASAAVVGGIALLLASCAGREPDMVKGPPQFAELMPAAMAPPPPPPPPAPEAMMAPAPAMGPMYGGHLASYSREPDATRGWNQIVRQHSSIGTLKRYLIPADTSKGRMLRLIAGDFPTLDEAQRFCAWAKQQRLYCAVMELGADGRSAKPLPAPRRPARSTPAAPRPASPPPASR